MRCLFCGKRLALLRKLTDGEFCSTAHRKRYLEEEQKLALARLIEEQHRTDRRQSAHPPAPQVRAEQGIQEPAGFRGMEVEIQSKPFSPMVPPQRLEESTRAFMLERHGQAVEFAKSLARLEAAVLQCREPVPVQVPAPARRTSLEGPLSLVPEPQKVGFPISNAAGPKTAGLSLLEPDTPKDSARVSVPPRKASVFLRLTPPAPPEPGGLGQAEPAIVSLLFAIHQAGAGAGAPITALDDLRPTASVVAVTGPKASGLRTTGIAPERATAAESVDSSGRLAPAVSWRIFELAKTGTIVYSADPAGQPFPVPFSYPAQRTAKQEPSLLASSTVPREIAGRGSAAARPSTTASYYEPVAVQALPTPGSAMPWQTAWTCRSEPALITPVAANRPVTCLGEAHSVTFRPVTAQPVSPAPGLALLRCGRESGVGAPLTIALRAAISSPVPSPAPPVAEAIHPVGSTFLSAAIRPCMPLIRTACPANPAPGAIVTRLEEAVRPLFINSADIQWNLRPPYREPAPAPHPGLLALEHTLEPRRQAVRLADAPAPAQLSRNAAIIPKIRIETSMPRCFRRVATGSAEPAPAPASAKPWMVAPRFWKMAPADLKWISLALPAILLVAMVSAVGWLPSKPVQATRVPAESTQTAAFENVVSEKWATVQRNIGSRAAINLQDDFRAGLAEWEGRGNWAEAWNYDPAGFILTGPLALYRPSRELTDYRFEFLGQIDKKSLNWVFRSADYNNYYAMKIVLLKSAPLPTAAIVRYAVINGKQDKPVQFPLPLAVRSDMFYRVRVEVRGENFTTTVQGQVVDFWSDSRLSRGGVGFFSEKGERARLRWMEVSHQYDALGRLCALLAPYNIQTGNGSLNRP